jgi:uncharacterized BrkB/YihY/UPF0761 family membrane protein
MKQLVLLLRRFVARLPGPVQSVLRVAVRTVTDSFADRVPGLAAEAAFFAVLSMPPLLLAILGGIGYAAIEVERVVEVISGVPALQSTRRCAGSS